MVLKVACECIILFSYVNLILSKVILSGIYLSNLKSQFTFRVPLDRQFTFTDNSQDLLFNEKIMESLVLHSNDMFAICQILVKKSQ